MAFAARVVASAGGAWLLVSQCVQCASFDVSSAPAPGGDAGSSADASSSEDAGSDAAAGDRAADYRAAVLAEDPLAYWRLGETSGTVAVDESRHHADATYDGEGCTLGKEASALGGGKQAPLFRSRCHVTAPADFGVLGRSTFTFEAWVRADATDASHNRKIFDNGATMGSMRNQVGLYVGGQGPGIRFERFAGSEERFADTSKLPLGVPLHVAAVYDGAKIRLFVDGKAVDEAATATPQEAWTAAFILGGNGEGPSDDFEGVIEEVAVYDKALNTEIIERHFTIGHGR